LAFLAPKYLSRERRPVSALAAYAIGGRVAGVKSKNKGGMEK